MIRVSRISSVVLAGALIGCASTPAAMSSGSVQMNADRGSRTALHDSMRKLWADHVIYTREYIVAAAAGLPSAQATSVRLLRNQEDIGNAIAPYYGNAAGARLTDLLKQHILIAVDLVTAAKAGDTAKQTDADRRWHDNAAEIATFLSNANPNWPRQTLLDMLNQHLALTTQEAVARLHEDWPGSVTLFDQIFAQAMTMADALSGGIAKQFPTKV
jgi:hypothetical protein